MKEVKERLAKLSRQELFMAVLVISKRLMVDQNNVPTGESKYDAYVGALASMRALGVFPSGWDNMDELECWNFAASRNYRV